MTQSPPSPRPRTVLVVDDESTVRLTLVYCLELGGFKALDAESAATALRLLAEEPIWAALIDVRMPGTNGFDCGAMLRMRAAELGRPLELWLMSGYPRPADYARAQALGARRLLRKPFDFAALLAEMRAVLDGGS